MFGLGKLLLLPYTLPAAGIRYCLNKVVEVADQELTDETPITHELMLLSLRLEEGEIDEAEFRRLEAPLLAQFSAIRAYRKQQAREELEAQIAETGARRVYVVDAPEVLEERERPR